MKSQMQNVQEAIANLKSLSPEDFKATLISAGAVELFVEELYKDGKSPVQYFGTTWDKLEVLDAKLKDNAVYCGRGDETKEE